MNKHQRGKINPLTPGTDWQLISPHSITAELNIRVVRIKKSSTEEAIDR